MLTADETRIASESAASLAPYLGGPESVIVDYIKRDGSPRVLVGRVTEFVGHDSTCGVILETEQGPRTANLYLIQGIRTVSKPRVI
jgi:hypothetical protein